MEKHARKHKKARFLVSFIIISALIVFSAVLGYRFINPTLITKEPESSNTITSTAPPTAVPDNAISENIFYTTQETNMYEEADSDSQIRAKLKKGTPVEYLGTQDDYTIVFYNGREGFIKTKYLSELMPSTDSSSKNGTYRVNHANGEPIFLRNGKGESYDIIEYIPDGTVLDVKEITDEWAYVEYNDNEGYVKTKYLEKNESLKNKTEKNKSIKERN